MRHRINSLMKPQSSTRLPVFPSHLEEEIDTMEVLKAKAGYLCYNRTGGQSSKGAWVMKSFVLTETSLHWFSHGKGRELIALSDMREAKAISSDDTQRLFTLNMLDGSTFSLAAPNKDKRDSWLEALNTFAVRDVPAIDTVGSMNSIRSVASLTSLSTMISIAEQRLAQRSVSLKEGFMHQPNTPLAQHRQSQGSLRSSGGLGVVSSPRMSVGGPMSFSAVQTLPPTSVYNISLAVLLRYVGGVACFVAACLALGLSPSVILACAGTGLLACSHQLQNLQGGKYACVSVEVTTDADDGELVKIVTRVGMPRDSAEAQKAKHIRDNEAEVQVPSGSSFNARSATNTKDEATCSRAVAISDTNTTTSATGVSEVSKASNVSDSPHVCGSSRSVGSTNSTATSDSAVAVEAEEVEQKVDPRDPDGTRIQAMREKYPDENDVTLRRFLVARKYVLKDAITMRDDDLRYRREISPATDEELAVIIRMGTFYYHGRARDNTPIFITPVKNLDVKQMSIPQLQKMLIHNCDRVKRLCPESESFTCIVDLEGLSLFKNVNMSMLLELVNLLNKCMPEVLCRVWIVNAPFVFRGIWSILSKAMDAHTIEKISFCTPSEYPSLHKFASPENLPKKYGGTSNFDFNEKFWSRARPDFLLDGFDENMDDESLEEQLAALAEEEKRSSASGST